MEKQPCPERRKPVLEGSSLARCMPVSVLMMRVWLLHMRWAATGKVVSPVWVAVKPATAAVLPCWLVTREIW